MITHYPLSLSAKTRGYHIVTTELLTMLPELPLNGLLNLFIQHTSAAITINEFFLAEQIIPIFTCADILFNI